MRVRLVLAASAVSLAAAAPAQAASVVGSTGLLLFSANSGETNNVLVTHQGGDVYTLTDANAVSAQPDCADDGSPAPGEAVTCTGVTTVALDLADGADSASITGAAGIAPFAVAGGADADTITGGPGPDVFDGGDGPDTIDGGAGDDLIGSSDLSADSITCGSGFDTVVGDDRDTVGADCEAVTRAEPGLPPLPPGTEGAPGAPGTGDGTPGGPGGGLSGIATGEDAIPAVVRIVKRRRDVAVRITCKASAACIGTLRLTASDGTVLARTTYALAAGRSATHSLKLGRAARTWAKARPTAQARVISQAPDGTSRRLGQLKLGG